MRLLLGFLLRELLRPYRGPSGVFRSAGEDWQGWSSKTERPGRERARSRVVLVGLLWPVAPGALPELSGEGPAFAWVLTLAHHAQVVDRHRPLVSVFVVALAVVVIGHAAELLSSWEFSTHAVPEALSFGFRRAFSEGGRAPSPREPLLALVDAFWRLFRRIGLVAALLLVPVRMTNVMAVKVLRVG